MTLITFILYAIEFLYCAIDVMLLDYFCRVYLSRKKISKVKVGIIYLSTTLAIFLTTLPFFYSKATSIVSIVFILVYGILVYGGRLKDRIMAVSFFYVVLGIVTLLITTVVPLIFSLETAFMMQDPILRLILVLLTKSLFLMLIYISDKYLRKSTKKILDLKSLLFFLVVVFLVLILVFDITFLSENIPTQRLVIVMSITLIIFICMIAVLTIKYFNSLELNMVYAVKLKESELKNKEYLRTTQEQIDLMSLKHDLKNHLIILENNVREGTKEMTLKYLGKLMGHTGLKTYVNTNNIVINAIVNQKISEHPNIKFNVRHDGGDFDVESSNLTIILGNALDNAIEAVQKKQGNETSVIKITLSENATFIKFFISNPIYVQPIIENGSMKSQKGTKFSGWGMKNIQRAVDSVSGFMKYEMVDEVFKLTILIKK